MSSSLLTQLTKFKQISLSTHRDMLSLSQLQLETGIVLSISSLSSPKMTTQ